MKITFLFLLLAITLVLGACSNTEETTSKTKDVDEVIEELESETLSTGSESSEDQDTSTQNETEGMVLQTGQEETTDTPELFDIQLNTESNTIELQYSEEKAVVLAKDSPSEPLKSPNGEKAAYISPWGFEELSNLYIVDLQDGSQNILVSFDPEEKPKDVIWVDDEHVVVIIGYPYGTVSVGGGLYRINVETNEKEAVSTDSDPNVEITDLIRIEDGVLYYSGIQYTDEIQNEYKDYSNQITLETE